LLKKNTFASGHSDEWTRIRAASLLYRGPGIPPDEEAAMAKGQKKSNREVRKPKADKGPKKNASQPSLKTTGLGTVETIKNR